MRVTISDRTLLRPKSVGHALRLLRHEGPLVPLAGCTDLYVGLNFGTVTERRFLDLWPLDELRLIRARGGVLAIGALTTYADIVKSPLVNAWVPMLAAASREIGGPQIQNRGTLGGNVANASPAGDTLPVLAAANATVVLASAAGERRVPFNAFYTGYRRTVIESGEIITALEIPRVAGRQFFRKVGTRAAQSISKVVMAAAMSEREGPRIALGSVAPTVLRLRRTEAALASGASLQDAQHTLQTEIAPVDDSRSTAEYRRRVAANLLARFWESPARR
jgi:CO/xanthine dehydrogenase FAD-binding subunit